MLLVLALKINDTSKGVIERSGQLPYKAMPFLCQTQSQVSTTPGVTAW